MQSENKLLIPLAVIVAGVLIGGAVYFKGSTPAPNNNGTASGNITIEPVTSDDHILGNPNAEVVVITFSDIDCPFCASFDVTMRQIMETYGKDGRVAWVYRHFPLDQLHPDARVKAESTECVAALAGNDAFWNYTNALFVTTNETVAGLGDIAASVGVDKSAFEACVAAGTYKKNVADDVTDATTAGGRGTPYSVIIASDGTKMSLNGALPYAQVEQTLKTFLVE